MSKKTESRKVLSRIVGDAGRQSQIENRKHQQARESQWEDETRLVANEINLFILENPGALNYLRDKARECLTAIKRHQAKSGSNDNHPWPFGHKTGRPVDTTNDLPALYLLLALCHDDILGLNKIINQGLSEIRPEQFKYPNNCDYSRFKCHILMYWNHVKADLQQQLETFGPSKNTDLSFVEKVKTDILPTVEEISELIRIAEEVRKGKVSCQPECWSPGDDVYFVASPGGVGFGESGENILNKAISMEDPEGGHLFPDEVQLLIDKLLQSLAPCRAIISTHGPERLQDWNKVEGWIWSGNPDEMTLLIRELGGLKAIVEKLAKSEESLKSDSPPEKRYSGIIVRLKELQGKIEKITKKIISEPLSVMEPMYNDILERVFLSPEWDDIIVKSAKEIELDLIGFEKLILEKTSWDKEVMKDALCSLSKLVETSDFDDFIQELSRIQRRIEKESQVISDQKRPLSEVTAVEPKTKGPSDPNEGSVKNKKKRGRPSDTDLKEDKRLYEAWKSGGHGSLEDLATQESKSKRDIHLAIDRHRKRIGRKNNDVE